MGRNYGRYTVPQLSWPWCHLELYTCILNWTWKHPSIAHKAMMGTMRYAHDCLCHCIHQLEHEGSLQGQHHVVHTAAIKLQTDQGMSDHLNLLIRKEHVALKLSKFFLATAATYSLIRRYESKVISRLCINFEQGYLIQDWSWRIPRSRVTLISTATSRGRNK